MLQQGCSNIRFICVNVLSKRVTNKSALVYNGEEFNKPTGNRNNQKLIYNIIV